LAARNGQVVTLDTNIAVYALTFDPKHARAREVLRQSDFLSVQVLNEYANAARRKLGRDWDATIADLADLREATAFVRPVTDEANADATRIAQRYQINFYDALIVAVALAGGADILYSEDMQHDMVIDGSLTIINPFAQDDL
jgi:predicted nucleic acid-binding protein